MDLWNRTENPELNYFIYDLLLFNKNAKMLKIQWEVDTLLNKSPEDNGISNLKQ